MPSGIDINLVKTKSIKTFYEDTIFFEKNSPSNKLKSLNCIDNKSNLISNNQGTSNLEFISSKEKNKVFDVVEKNESKLFFPDATTIKQKDHDCATHPQN